MTYLLVCFGQKTGALPPILSRHHWLTSWMPFPPLLMSICSANCNRISFSWTAFSVVFLLVVGCPFRNIGRCGKACPPEQDVFKIWSLTFSQALKVLGLTYTGLFFNLSYKPVFLNIWKKSFRCRSCTLTDTASQPCYLQSNSSSEYQHLYLFYLFKESKEPVLIRHCKNALHLSYELHHMDIVSLPYFFPSLPVSCFSRTSPISRHWYHWWPCAVLCWSVRITPAFTFAG